MSWGLPVEGGTGKSIGSVGIEGCDDNGRPIAISAPSSFSFELLELSNKQVSGLRLGDNVKRCTYHWAR
jgi:hypothetical protein